VLKNILKFPIKFLLEGDDESVALHGAIGGAKQVAEGTSIEGNHRKEKAQKAQKMMSLRTSALFGSLT
jgi:hypothetical protein